MHSINYGNLSANIITFQPKFFSLQANTSSSNIATINFHDNHCYNSLLKIMHRYRELNKVMYFVFHRIEFGPSLKLLETTESCSRLFLGIYCEIRSEVQLSACLLRLSIHK